MIKFTYIIGANIELFVKAQFIAEDTETGISEKVEILEVIDSEGLEVQTDEIVIDRSKLDFLLEVAAFEARSEQRSSTGRVLKHREEAAKQGRKRKEYLVTDSEHLKIKRLITGLREG